MLLLCLGHNHLEHACKNQHADHISKASPNSVQQMLFQKHINGAAECTSLRSLLGQGISNEQMHDLAAHGMHAQLTPAALDLRWCYFQG